MKKAPGVEVVFLSLLVLAVSAQGSESKDKAVRHIRQPFNDQYALRESADPDYHSEAAVDTYTIVYYSFETHSWQGWTRADLTAQVDTFWHVEDYLEPELAGLPGPIEGAKSAWCGAPPGPEAYVCRWIAAPGYGNKWDQSFVTCPLYFTGYLDIGFHARADCEQGYDYLRLEYDAGGGDWEEIVSHSGKINAAEQHRLAVAMGRTKLRFHFTSDVATSDEDGFLDTNGAAHIDSITIADAIGTIDFEDFESASDGAKRCGIWHADVGPSFGMYSGLFAAGLGDKDPCNENLTTQVVFFINSPYPSTSYPGLDDTPFCKGAGWVESPCQNEMVISPVIDLTKYSTAKNGNQNAAIPPGELPLLGGLWLRFTMYDDLPMGNCVIHTWYMRQILPSGCHGTWSGTDYIFPSYGSEYAFVAEDIARGAGSADSIQIALGIIDMSYAWYPGSSCAAHTPAPWYDNVQVLRFKNVEPQWRYQDRYLFQDNFPGEEYIIESYVRADEAEDISASSSVIHPGDSVVVECYSTLGGGLAEDPLGGPAVYMHVKCSYIGPSPVKPPLAGPSLQGTYGTYKSDDGTWTIIQGDTARWQGEVAMDNYMFDLSDSLFTRGYEIEYYFTARNNAGYESALPRWARSNGPYFEFTCLPTKNSDILYVDDCHGRGSFAGAAEEYWTSALKQIFPMAPIDRYDVNAPTAGEGNGLGARAKLQQLIDNYYTIIWDSGDLWSYTISDGTYDKSNDCQMLIDWMDLSDHRVGLWVCGDNVAEELEGMGRPQPLSFLHTWCGVDFLHYSYCDETGGDLGGGIVNPLLTGDADAGVFTHGGVPDAFYIYGGCPWINHFDVLGKTNQGKYALDYPDYGGNHYYAGIANTTLNAGGYQVRTMWFGFSFQYIRDDVGSDPIDRMLIARDVFSWMQYPTNPMQAEIPSAYKLAQNHPNPFNPTTTIQLDMKEKGVVTLKIYNVAGQLVRTLLDGVKDAGSYSIAWDGKNNKGAKVGSGIYFYKMDAKGFNSTKKMVILE